ncbi:MAG: carboxypeptidase regulatory-like domain-containing protein [Acidobacteria bacterium]|nr:carboxypeptidase regulatory-like domain-containing protein [Acidobacteriota bacterium]
MMRNLTFLLRVFSLLTVLTLAIHAQTATATLRGSVTDGSGNITPGAAVTLTQTSTNLKRTFTVGETGQYSFTFLEPGRYILEVQVKGFKTFRQEQIELAVAQAAELNVMLQPGDIAETINVSAGETSLQLDTASAALGGVVQRTQIDNLPLNGRNVFQLAQLEVGVNTSPGSRSATPNLSAGGVGEISINGGRTLTNEIVVDGMPITNKADNLPSFRPSPEAVQEFRIVTNTYSAEYGRTGGGALNFSVRSGSTQVRGTLFEFLRNDAFDAANFFVNQTGSQKEKFRFNQFGGNLGGPVYLPRFGEGGPAVKKLDKLFFFFNYEGLRVRQARLRQSNVPTLKQRDGDFSELLGATIANVNVRDTNGTLIPARVGMIYVPGAVVAAGQPGAGSRVVFANNVIPAARFNAVGLNLLRSFPLPNRTGFTNNYVVNSPSASNENQVVARLDYSLSQKHLLYGRVIKDFSSSFNAGPFPGNIAGTQASPILRSRPSTAVVDYVWTISPRVVFHANGGMTQSVADSRTYSDGYDPTTLGFPSYLANASGDARVFPSATVTGYTTLGPPRNFGNARNIQDIFSFNQDVSFLFGAHSLKLGANERSYRIYNNRPDDPAGNFTFTRAFTARTAADAQSGDAVASLLLGNPSTGRLAIVPQPAVQSLYYAFFAQDDWQVNKRLTLNLGLRWEADLGNTERFNRLTNFDLQGQFPISSLSVAFPTATGLGTRTLNLRGAVTPVGRGTVSTREQYDRDLNNWGPRIGLALKLDDKTVLRAGGGIFYASNSGGGFATQTYALSDTAETPFIATLDNVTPTPGTSLSNPFPNGIVQVPTAFPGAIYGYGQQILPVKVRNIRQPKIGQWNLSLQRELPGHLKVQAAYAGSASMGLLSGPTDLNQLTPENLALGATILNTTVANPFLTLPTNQRPASTSILGRATVTVAQLLRPYPQFGNVVSYNMNEAHATYHSLQLRVERRFSDGLLFTAGYTFAKTIDDVSGISAGATIQVPNYQNYYDRRSNKALSTFDVRHRFIGNVTWRLPFGYDGRYLKSGVTGQVLGGWGVNAIVQAQGGFPLSITAVSNGLQGLAFVGGNAAVGILRPNLIGDPVIADATQRKTTLQWFNTAAFQVPAQYTFGNAPRTFGNLRGPGYFGTNLSLQRNFRITEATRLQFRAEAFNLFNRANFTTPAAILGAANFGRLLAAEDARQMQLALKLYF